MGCRIFSCKKETIMSDIAEKSANDNSELIFRIPDWLTEWEATLPKTVENDETAMQVALKAARMNVEQHTGGPFGAIVVDETDRSIFSVGVNLVVFSRSSVLHAEMVAMMRAQLRRRFHRVGGASHVRTTLYTSAEPCAMCMGAIPWSGIDRVVCGASDADVRKTGFDEGHKPPDWVAAYALRGIAVTTDVLRSEAVCVLEDYRRAGGVVY